ncbi:hypothetical protein [Bradyrhizobium sp. Gha]|uniref:hypothetical protein n=1 Tax=Bradyrhizobium sp. Gha TaxID=1855318 RepID=UPI0008EB7752|nr:hypothetical protein [Bradyrhizobium sp. Gha]SFH83388.1 hypothetical protein SAMN05216525_102184 [Bradyrhizobium sp. Gha]
MRALTAYFVGAGSIIAAIAIGLGGGIVAGNIMHPIAPKQGPDTAKAAQRAEASAPAMTSAPSERVQYLTGSQSFGAMIAAPAQAQSEAKPDAGTSQASAEPPKPTPSPSPQTTKPVEQQASTEPASSPENAYAKASNSDVKRAASERRRAERHERWARHRYEQRDVRGYEQRDARGMRDQTNWDDVARNVREDSDARDSASRPRGGFPQIRLFGPDDDD